MQRLSASGRKMKQAIITTALIAFALGVPVGVWMHQWVMCDRLAEGDLLAAYNAVCEDPLQGEKP
jgi:ABC-type nitrate/sulfonate/bicarbonate transport system permease component